jgi:hypothetical protein
MDEPDSQLQYHLEALYIGIGKRKVRRAEQGTEKHSALFFFFEIEKRTS